VKQENIAKTFIYAGLLFGIVPITLSLLGFIGATEVNRGPISVPTRRSLDGLIAALLPKAALYAFTLMAFAGLCSTLDSSLWCYQFSGSVDIYGRYINRQPSDGGTVRAARFA